MIHPKIYLTGALDYPGRQSINDAAIALQEKGYDVHSANLPAHELTPEERADHTELSKLRMQTLLACDQVVTMDNLDQDPVAKHEALWARSAGIPVTGIQAFMARHENGAQKLVS